MKLAFFFRKYHKWLALIVGVQALIWCISGLYMTAIHIDFIHGDHLVKTQKTTELSSFKIKPLQKSFVDALGEIESIGLSVIQSKPVYSIKTTDKSVKINASTLETVELLNESSVRAIANNIYAGENKINRIELLDAYPAELGGREQSIWKVEYDDWLQSTLYFLPETGQLRSTRSNLWRVFDFLWMLHIMDYDTRSDINNNILRVAASIGLLLTLTGLGLLFYSFKNKVSANPSITGTLKKIHKWITVFIGLQLMLWMFTGLMFSLLSHKEVGGRYLLNKAEKVNWIGQADDFNQLLSQYPDAVSIKSTSLSGKSAYQLTTLVDKFIVTTGTLDKLVIDEKMASELAKQAYAGEGQLIVLNQETQQTTENRKFELPVWRANFDDEQYSSLYLSAKTGQIYGLKTETWRWFDIFWMLHIMDYTERNDMNNSLLIFSVSLISFVAITGLWLLFSVFKLSDFNLMARFRRVPILLKGAQQFSSEIFAQKNSNLYQALSKQGFELPSNCGGGGSCGLCRVKVDSGAPISEADYNLITQEEINLGYRLACQLNLQQGLEVELPTQVLNQQIFSCKVIQSQFVTPLIIELKLAVPEDIDFQFNAGEYVLLHIPQGRTDLRDIKVSAEYQSIWRENDFAQYLSNRTEVISRAYSMANPPKENQHILLNVRLALPTDKLGESGKASSYLAALNVGDEVKVSGSFGHFHAQANQNELIFIGGGAGMAPLRSHIIHQLKTLKNQSKISFWFGARDVDEIFYQQEFDVLQQEHANFSWQVALSDPNVTSKIDPKVDKRWHGETGMIHEVLQRNYLNQLTNIKLCDFYICGPPLMNQAVRRMLVELGVNQKNIHIDDFGS